jgi:CitMHS family citrate-Mg2+:H+ or citrate-Ca2+:H+ symporter
MSSEPSSASVLPVLSETAGHYGISAGEMARASITGQPFHPRHLATRERGAS